MKQETATISRALLIATSTTQLIILLAYLVEVIKGERTIPYYLLLAGIILIPSILAWIAYAKQPEHNICRYIGLIGFLTMYSMVLLTGDTILTFVYVLAPLSYLIVCASTRLLVLTLIWTLTSNLAYIIYHIGFLKETSPDHIANYEIQLFSLFLCLIFSMLSTKLQYRLNKSKLDTVVASEQQASETLERILRLQMTYPLKPIPYYPWSSKWKMLLLSVPNP